MATIGECGLPVRRSGRIAPGLRSPAEGGAGGPVLRSSTAEGEGNEGDAVGETPAGATGSPKAFGPLPQLFGWQPVKRRLRNFLTFPTLCGIGLRAMKTIQMR